MNKARVWVLTDERYLKQRMPRALIEWLRIAGVAVEVMIAEQLVAEISPAAQQIQRDPWSHLASGDVVVARTRNVFALALLRAAQRPGIQVATRWTAVMAARNKARAAQILASNGIPTPRTFLADSPGVLKQLPDDCFPLLLKPHLGDNARGIVYIRHQDELDDVNWVDGMVLGQQFVDAANIDLKLYVAGERVWAVRRPSPIGSAASSVAAPAAAEVTEGHRSVALACARAFGLELCGVDVVEDPSGPLVVDVNDFPNYTGVAEAPAAIADVLPSGPVVRAAR